MRRSHRSHLSLGVFNRCSKIRFQGEHPRTRPLKRLIVQLNLCFQGEHPRNRNWILLKCVFLPAQKSVSKSNTQETDLDTLRLLEEEQKIAKHSKNLRFVILFVFEFACFQLVVQIPLGTQLVQNGMKMVPNTDPLG